jgi:L-seryl-tRNA(Ser) seleniumtransferase
LSDYGLTDEPVIRRSIADGADVFRSAATNFWAASQSGLIVGRREVVEKIRKHPLYRALRVDKLIYAALEATFESFRRENHLAGNPGLANARGNKRRNRSAHGTICRKIASKTRAKDSGLHFEVIEGKSVVGGGSAPTVQPETTLIALKHRAEIRFQIRTKSAIFASADYRQNLRTTRF